MQRCVGAGSFISDFLTAMSVSAARTRSSHTRWRNKLLPLSLRIDFPTVPYKGYFLSKSELPTRNPTPRAHQYVSATVVSTQQGITRYEGYFLPTPFAC